VINCLVIDDEPLSLNLLEEYIQKIPYLKLTGSFGDPMQALPFIERRDIDLLFLDIKLPGITGIEFYRSLSFKPEVVFTTAYSEFAIKAYELKAIDYLVKPILFENFLAACNRIKDYLEYKRNPKNHKKDYFFINVAHKLYKIFYNDILYMEGFKDYTKVYLTTSNAPLLILHNLKYFEDGLDKNEFVRIHRSYIVSIRKINTVSRKSVTIGNDSFPVSDNYRERFFSLINNL
jgi:two-component system, LytTR family, response regulator